jgi:hypothetical protein
MGYVASILAPFVVYLVSCRNVWWHINSTMETNRCLEENLDCRVRKLLDSRGNCSTTTHFKIFASHQILGWQKWIGWLACSMHAVNGECITNFSCKTWMYEKTLEILA